MIYKIFYLPYTKPNKSLILKEFSGNYCKNQIKTVYTAGKEE